jgi:para-nitrobenzyl esterase
MRPTSTDEHVVVEIESGAVRGFWRTHSAAFLGIPLAEPPYGDLRFLAPVPVQSWTGVRDALQYGAYAATQGAGRGDHYPGAEHPR